MRDAICLLIFCFWAYPKLLAQPAPASIEGTVVHSISGAPLPGAHVGLRADASEAAFGAISDRAGHFAIAGLPPDARFRFEVELPGFLVYPTTEQATSGPIMRTFHAGEHVQGFRIEMAPRAILSGRVLDENGDPVTATAVIARRLPPKTPSHIGGPYFTQTDDSGRFRIPVVPEKYYVIAPGFSNEDPPADARGSGTVDRPYAVTFYPSAPNTESAIAVEARAGSEVDGLDIHLQRASVTHVSGRVTGIPPNARRTSVTVESDPEGFSMSVFAEKDGAFRIERVPSGDNRIFAEAQAGDATWWSRMTELKAGTGSVESVQLVLEPGLEVRGRIDSPAGDRIQHLSFVPVTANQSRNSRWARLSVQVETDGSFEAKGLRPVTYELQPELTNDDWYVSKLVQGDRELPDQLLDAGGAGSSAPIRLTVAADGAQISGTLTTPDGFPMLREGSIYLILGDEVTPRHLRFESTEDDGTFTIRGLAPGEYRMIAAIYGVTAFGSDHWADLKAWSQSTDRITIHAGDHLVKNVRVQGAK